MDSFLEPEKKKSFFSPGILLGAIIAIVLIGTGIFLLSLVKPITTEHSTVLDGATFEGSPGFDDYTKQIIISTDPDKLQQSMTGLGTITMFIGSSIYNKGDRALTAIEVLVSVIDTKNEVIKEKKFVVLPTEKSAVLEPGEKMDTSVSIGGFSRDDDRANVRWKVTAFKLQ
ncbi:MAG: hypothetical protein ACK5NT_02030 [Pyrinomonadaceae bacterium]